MSEAKVISIHSSKIIEQVCVVCHSPFGINEFTLEQRRIDGKPFYCPNGHSMVFSNSLQSQLDRLQEKLAKIEKLNENNR